MSLPSSVLVSLPLNGILPICEFSQPESNILRIADGQQLQEYAEIRLESAERNYFRICTIRMIFDRYASGVIKPTQKI